MVARTQRSRHRRIELTKLTFEQILDGISGLSPRWDLLDLTGAVALATKDALLLGRELVLEPGFDDA